MASKWRTFGVKCSFCGEVVLVFLKRAFAQDKPDAPTFCPICKTMNAWKELEAQPRDPDGEGKF